MRRRGARPGVLEFRRFHLTVPRGGLVFGLFSPKVWTSDHVYAVGVG